MVKSNQKTIISILIAVLVFMSLACGSIQVGVVTPTPETASGPVAEIQESEPGDEPVVKADGESEAESLPALTPEPVAESTPASQAATAITAWLGHIASLPEGSQYDDVVILSPEGTGEFGLTGATAELEAEIRSLRDAAGAEEYIHLWGTLSCQVDDYNGCQLVVDKMQYGANYAEEEIEGWTGTIKSSTFNSGISYVFELSGEYPMWYSIWASQDVELQGQIERLRDTGALVNVGGMLMVGIPDVNGTRIEISQLEVVEAGVLEQGALPTTVDPTASWPVFTSDRYGYQIKYPREATISLHGPDGFSGEELPEGMSAEQYMDQLLKEYTTQLCVEIQYSLGTIYISAPPNQEFHYSPCGPTGVGAGEIIQKVETVYVGDQLYQANGHEIKLWIDGGGGGTTTGETLDLHYEWFSVELEDGTRFRFGAPPRQDATYEDYLIKTKEVLLQILGTYQAAP